MRGGAALDGEFPTRDELRPLLRPRGIAVVGASADATKFSGRLVASLLASGYRGGLYPVNPRYREVAGLPCFPGLAAVPDPCDLVLVAVPARFVVDVVAEAADRGLGAAIILSAGFAELGESGQERARALAALRFRIRIYGPNCPGLWQIADGLVYTFSSQFDPGQLRPGRIGVVTQGGALGRALLDAMQAGLGFSYWFSTGNEADLECSDFVAFLAEEPRTAVVAVLAEGWRDGRRFLRAVARCRRAGKPVAVLKLGRSAAGARAAEGHTAAANGSAALAAALLRRAGCLQADDVDELGDLAGLLDRHGAPGPGGLGVCTFSGGAGVLLADLAAANGVPLPDLDPGTVRALRALLPEIAAVGNPTDLTTAVLEDPALARRALEIMAADVGIALVLFPLPHRLDAFDEAMAAHLVAAAATCGKPVAVVAVSPVFDREAAAGILRRAGVPIFGSARRAVLAASRWLAYGRSLALPPYAPLAAAGAGAGPGAGPAEPGPGAPPPPGTLRCTAFDDPVFGPAVRCAWSGSGEDGGAFRLAPLDLAEAEAMLRELDGPGLQALGGEIQGLARHVVEWSALVATVPATGPAVLDLAPAVDGRAAGVGARGPADPPRRA